MGSPDRGADLQALAIDVIERLAASSQDENLTVQHGVLGGHDVLEGTTAREVEEGATAGSSPA